MTRFTDPGLEADDVVRRLRGALDELTADISETTVGDHPMARVRELHQQPSRRTWLVPAAAAAAVVAVVVGVVVVGNRDDGGPSGPPVSVPDTGVTVPVQQTVAGATFAPLDGLEPAGVPTFNTVMTAPLGAVWVSADGPDDWFVSVRQESDRDLQPGTLDGGIELEPVDIGGRTLYVEPGDAGGGGATVYEWQPDGQIDVANAFGLERDRLVEFVGSIQPGSGVPFILTSDEPAFSAAEVAILDPRPTYLSQPWTLDGASVRLSAATGGVARHLADLAASTLTVAPVTVAGVDGYRVDTDDGAHVLWRAVGGAGVWMSLSAPAADVDELVATVTQRPTAVIVGGRAAREASQLGALNGWITTSVEDAVELPLVDVVSDALSVDDGTSTTPLVIDALPSATVGEILTITRDLRGSRRIVLVTADETWPSANDLNDVLRTAASSTQNVVIADWAAALADGSATDTPEDWAAIVADAVSSVEDDADTAPIPDVTSPPPGD